jgi:hypothetical protein
MSGGMKGPSSSGSITQNTINPTQQAQLPFLQSGWNQAQQLSGNDPFEYYPGQTLAPQNPWMGTGFNDVALTGNAVDQTLRPAGNNIFFNAANGSAGVQNSPAYTILQALAGGGGNQVGPQQGLVDLATAAQAGDAGTDALGATARGDYLNSNPYLDKMFGSASDAVTRSYQTATAPQTDASYESAGRYGSGALSSARSQNQNDLGNSLGRLSSDIYGGNYARERQAQNSAAGVLDSILNARKGLASGALSASGQLGLAGAGLQKSAADTLQSGFQTGNNQLLQTLGLLPSVMNAQYNGADAMVRGGQGMTALEQQQIDDAMKRFYGNISAPWQTNQTFLNQVGQPTTGSSSVTSPLLGPSPLSSMLGLAGGANSLFGSNGALGGKGSSGLAGVGAGNLTGADALSGGLGMGAMGADFGGGAAGGKGLSSMLPFLAA